MPRMKGADLITEYLIDSKIPYVFGICGHGNVGILDALYEARDRIALVSPRHEQVAAHMADAGEPIAAPLLEKLSASFLGAEGAARHLQSILSRWQAQEDANLGYGPGNVVNLLRLLCGGACDQDGRDEKDESRAPSLHRGIP